MSLVAEFGEDANFDNTVSMQRIMRELPTATTSKPDMIIYT